MGIYHEENQDSFLEDSQNMLFAVADGVGGYYGAKEASSMAVDLLKSNAHQIVDEATFQNVISNIHLKINERAKELGFVNMGTTLAAAKILRGKDDSKVALCANVGDSPILLFSGGSFEKMYVDDSHRELDRSAVFGITQYLGLDCDLDIHITKRRCVEGDVLLLCSDGITDNLASSGDYDTLSRLMLNHPSAKRIVKQAMQSGLKPDDMTAVLVFF